MGARHIGKSSEWAERRFHDIGATGQITLADFGATNRNITGRLVAYEIQLLRVWKTCLDIWDSKSIVAPDWIPTSQKLRLLNGRWRSKLGIGPLIEHRAPRSLEGDEYGRPYIYMRKPREN